MCRSLAPSFLLLYALLCAGQKLPPSGSAECPADKVRVATAYGSYCGDSSILRDAPPAYIACHGLTYIPAYSAADGVFVRNLACGEAVSVLGADGVWRKLRLRDGEEVWAGWDAVRLGAGPIPAAGGDTRGMSAPRALYAPDPVYSEEAQRAGLRGTVVLWLVVGADGRPRDIKVQRTLGMGLDEKAMEAVRTWKFEPARLNGNPVAVQINVEVNFRLYATPAKNQQDDKVLQRGKEISPVSGDASLEDPYPLRVKVIQTENSQIAVSSSSVCPQPPFRTKAEAKQAVFCNLGALLRDLASVRGRTASLVEASDGNAYVIACDSTSLHACTWLRPSENEFAARWTKGGLTVRWWAGRDKKTNSDKWKEGTYYVVTSRRLEK